MQVANGINCGHEILKGLWDLVWEQLLESCSSRLALRKRKKLEHRRNSDAWVFNFGSCHCLHEAIMGQGVKDSEAADQMQKLEDKKKQEVREKKKKKKKKKEREKKEKKEKRKGRMTHKKASK